MKIALIGYGKMGKMVEQAALSAGHAITVKIDPKEPTKAISAEYLAHADLCIDFSHPEHAIENLKKLALLKKDVVMGTTGWYDQLDVATSIVKNANIGFLYSPNFSIGIALFLNMIDHAAALMRPFPDYDVAGMEIHHHQKLDSPSGTAQLMSQRLEMQLPHKGKVPFSSVRVGAVPGTHSILFDSITDSITLTHTARNREGFALGAIKAAEWVVGKKGVFTLQDMF